MFALQMHLGRLIAAAFMMVAALTVEGSILEVRSLDRSGQTIEVESRGGSIHAFVRLIELRSGISITPEFEDFIFDAELRGLSPVEALLTVARQEGLEVGLSRRGQIVIRDPQAATVTMDVSQVAAESIVRQIATTCGYRSVWIPEPLDVKGTFRFNGVNCEIALNTILSSMRLQAANEGSGILLVKRAE